MVCGDLECMRKRMEEIRIKLNMDEKNIKETLRELEEMKEKITIQSCDRLKLIKEWVLLKEKVEQKEETECQ